MEHRSITGLNTVCIKDIPWHDFSLLCCVLCSFVLYIIILGFILDPGNVVAVPCNAEIFLKQFLGQDEQLENGFHKPYLYTLLFPNGPVTHFRS